VGYNKLLMEKIGESLKAVLPITAIVLVISVTIAPLTPGTLVLFLFGALLLIFGMGLFSLGVDMSMIPMGDGMGVEISKSKRVGIPLLVCFVLGVVVTIAEPDLQVLAEQVPAFPNTALVWSVAFGVGFFLVLALLDLDPDDPFESGLGDGYDPTGSDVLAQQHAKIGRCLGRWLVAVGQIEKRQGRVGGEQHSFLRGVTLAGEQKLIRFGLSYF